MSLRCALNQPAPLRTLLRASGAADVNAKDVDGDRTPLHWAAARGSLRCILLLLDAGADKTAVNASGQTPAELATEAGQILAHDLILYGPPKADPRSVHGSLFGVSLHSALNQPTQLKKLLRKGKEWRLGENGAPLESAVDLDAKDKDGDRAPLHWAAARGALQCIELLLHNGASPGITNADGLTAAALALEYNQRAAHAMIMDWHNATTSHRARMVAGGVSGKVCMHGPLRQAGKPRVM